MPGTSSTGTQSCPFFGYSQSDKFTESCRASFPALPQHLSQSASQPFVQSLVYTRGFCQAVICHPADQVTIELLQDVFQLARTRALGQSTDLVHKTFQRAFRYPNVGLPFLLIETEPQKFTFRGFLHFAFLRVDFQLQLLLQVLLHTLQHPFPRSVCLHVDVTLIRLAYKLVPSLLQFLIQIIQHEVRK